LEFNVPFQHKYGYIRDDFPLGDSCVLGLDKQLSVAELQYLWCTGNGDGPHVWYMN